MARPSAPIGPRRVLGLITRRLRHEAGSALAPFLRGVLTRAGARQSLDLGEDPDVRRFLWRLGWIDSGRRSATASHRVSQAVRELARDANEEELAVAVKLRLFASGEGAIGVEPVCGEMPRS